MIVEQVGTTMILLQQPHPTVCQIGTGAIVTEPEVYRNMIVTTVPIGNNHKSTVPVNQIHAIRAQHTCVAIIMHQHLALAHQALLGRVPTTHPTTHPLTLTTVRHHLSFRDTDRTFRHLLSGWTVVNGMAQVT